MKKTFTFIDLFAGIGGFRRGLEANGGSCVFSSEIDKFAAKAYEALYGEKPSGDITEIKAEDIPDHDVLAGGFPCQAFSVAGNRGGFEDARGTLFFEIARIAAEKKPKVLLLENVKGLIGHDRGKTLDTIVKTLNDIGYRIDFNVLNSKYFGVPQNRERIFIVGVREDLIPNEPWSEESTKGALVVPKGKRRILGYEDVKTFNFDWPGNDTVTTRLRDILEPEVGEKYYLSEDKTEKLVAQLEEKYDDPKLKVAEEVTTKVVGNTGATGHGNYNVYDTEGISPTLLSRDYKDPKRIAEEVRPVLTPDRLEKRQNGRRFKEDGEESITLTAQDRHGVAIREATTKGYAVASEGDAVNFQFPDSKTRRGRVGKEIANTLEASSINQGTPVKEGTRYRIRKLTPLECWRLQGFPDEAHEAVKDAGISDSQRYKQAGNAVTVNVIEALGERLLPYLASD